MKISEEILDTPIQVLKGELFDRNRLSVFVKREDKCHPVISGNKWHKLKLNLKQVKANDFSRIISFGGAWSNHLHALAYACMKEGLSLSAIVRGDELANKALNPMLQDMRNWGAQLHFVSRESYRLKEESELCKTLLSSGRFYLIPEGASNRLGMEGCEQFALKTLEQFKKEHACLPTHILLASGTGAMTAGFIEAVNKYPLDELVKVESYLAVRDKARVRAKVSAEIGKSSHLLSWELDDRYAGKGFGMLSTSVESFMSHFSSKYGFELDPVYTSKLFYGFFEDVKAGHFPEASRILLIHSGGLQGLRSMTEKNLKSHIHTASKQIAVL